MPLIRTRALLGLLATLLFATATFGASLASAAFWKPPIANITTAPGATGPFFPHSIASNPDGTEVYVANDSSPQIWVISTTTHAATGVYTLPAPATGTRTISTDPSGAYIYAAPEGVSGSVFKLDAHTGAVLGSIATRSESSFPNRLMISPDGSTLYATGWNSPSISVTDLATNTVSSITIPNVSQIQQGAFSPDGHYLYAAYMDGSAPNPKTGVVKIDLTNPSNTSVWTISATSQLDVTSVVINPDGSRVYAWDEDYADLIIFDTATGAKTTLDVGSSCDSDYCGYGNADALSISPCGCFLLATDQTGTPAKLWMVDLRTNAVTPLSPSDGFNYSNSHPPYATTFSADGTSAYITNRFNGGNIDVISAPGKPGAPTGVSVTPGSGKLDVSLTAPPVDGGSPITDYEYSLDGGAKWTSAATTGAKFTIAGLTNGTRYAVIVRAKNADCTGASSTVVSGTPEASAPNNSQANAEENPKITIPAAVVTNGATLTSTVSPSVAGTVKVTATLAGRTVCTATKNAAGAGRMTVTCNLTRGAKAVIRKRAVTLKVTARLTDAAGKSATATKSVKVARYVVRTPVTG